MRAGILIEKGELTDRSRHDYQRIAFPMRGRIAVHADRRLGDGLCVDVNAPYLGFVLAQNSQSSWRRSEDLELPKVFEHARHPGGHTQPSDIQFPLVHQLL